MTDARALAIRTMLPTDWPDVERIYAAGIATGDATFESETPSWDAFDAGKIPVGRLVSVGSGGTVNGWVAGSLVSARAAYRGVVEHSVYVDPAAQGRGVGRALLRAFIAAAESAGFWTIQSSPPAPVQRPYVATTEQIWALFDTLHPGYKNAVLLGAFAGLRAGEMVALQVDDIDDARGAITLARQHDGEELKSEASAGAIPIPAELLHLLRTYAGVDRAVPGVFGRGVTAYQLDRIWSEARVKVAGLPKGFRIHDLRHYFASLLIAAGLDIKTVQARMRHASATVTLNTYGHLWPDKDESTRAAITLVLETRMSPSS